MNECIQKTTRVASDMCFDSMICYICSCTRLIVIEKIVGAVDFQEKKQYMLKSNFELNLMQCVKRYGDARNLKGVLRFIISTLTNKPWSCNNAT